MMRTRRPRRASPESQGSRSTAPTLGGHGPSETEVMAVSQTLSGTAAPPMLLGGPDPAAGCPGFCLGAPALAIAQQRQRPHSSQGFGSIPGKQQPEVWCLEAEGKRNV